LEGLGEDFNFKKGKRVLLAIGIVMTKASKLNFNTHRCWIYWRFCSTAVSLLRQIGISLGCLSFRGNEGLAVTSRRFVSIFTQYFSVSNLHDDFKQIFNAIFSIFFKYISRYYQEK
jgi:ABC-type uncharacterized transport system permease subunit